MLILPDILGKIEETPVFNTLSCESSGQVSKNVRKRKENGAKNRMDRMVLGKRLKEERIRCAMTQEQTAEYVNVSTTYVGLVERGERSVTLEKLILFAKCFHVTVDYLLQDAIPLTSSLQDKQLMSLWSHASEQERTLILSVIQSVLGSSRDASSGQAFPPASDR